MISKGKIKSVPRGMAHAANETEYDSFEEECDSGGEENEVASALTKAQITNKLVCLVCGGLGHPAKLDGVGQCFSRTLNVRVDRSDLEAMEYPPGIRRPILNRPPRGNSSNASLAHKRKTFQPKKRFNRDHQKQPKPHAHVHARKGKAKQVEADYQNEDEEEVNEANNQGSSDESEDGEQHARLAIQFDDIALE